MQSKEKRKMTVHLVEKNEVFNLRVLSEVVARKIKKGELL